MPSWTLHILCSWLSCPTSCLVRHWWRWSYLTSVCKSADGFRAVWLGDAELKMLNVQLTNLTHWMCGLPLHPSVGNHIFLLVSKTEAPEWGPGLSIRWDCLAASLVTVFAGHIHHSMRSMLWTKAGPFLTKVIVTRPCSTTVLPASWIPHIHHSGQLVCAAVTTACHAHHVEVWGDLAATRVGAALALDIYHACLAVELAV